MWFYILIHVFHRKVNTCQNLKAPIPILSILFGMVTEEREVQNLKDWFPILVTPALKSTFFILLRKEKNGEESKLSV